MLLGVGLIVGLLYLIIPDIAAIFVGGFWHGIKAPVVFVLNIFGTKFRFYDNIPNLNLYNLGFLIGIFVWSSPPSFMAYQSYKRT